MIYSTVCIEIGIALKFNSIGKVQHKTRPEIIKTTNARTSSFAAKDLPVRSAGVSVGLVVVDGEQDQVFGVQRQGLQKNPQLRIVTCERRDGIIVSRRCDFHLG
jgi:hypothetical protein